MKSGESQKSMWYEATRLGGSTYDINTRHFTESMLCSTEFLESDAENCHRPVVDLDLEKLAITACNVSLPAECRTFQSWHWYPNWLLISPKNSFCCRIFRVPVLRCWQSCHRTMLQGIIITISKQSAGCCWMWTNKFDLGLQRWYLPVWMRVSVALIYLWLWLGFCRREVGTHLYSKFQPILFD